MMKRSKLAIVALVTAVAIASPALAQGTRNARQQGDQAASQQRGAAPSETPACKAGFWGACSK